MQDPSLAITETSTKQANLTLGSNTMVAGAQLAQDRQATNAVTFKARGEKVFAVQYRRVQMSRWPRKDVTKTKLKKGVTWKLYFVGTRGAEEPEVIDTMLAELEEDEDEDKGEGEDQGRNGKFLVHEGFTFGMR